MVLDRPDLSLKSCPMNLHQSDLICQRLQRLLTVMGDSDVNAILTSNPINILYATGARNMTVFSLMGPFRFALVVVNGPVVLWEFTGCEHLVADNPVITDVRSAPGISPIWGTTYTAEVERFIGEVKVLLGDDKRLAIEGFDMPIKIKIGDKIKE